MDRNSWVMLSAAVIGNALHADDFAAIADLAHLGVEVFDRAKQASLLVLAADDAKLTIEDRLRRAPLVYLLIRRPLESCVSRFSRRWRADSIFSDSSLFSILRPGQMLAQLVNCLRGRCASAERADWIFSSRALSSASIEYTIVTKSVKSQLLTDFFECSLTSAKAPLGQSARGPGRASHKQKPSK